MPIVEFNRSKALTPEFSRRSRSRLLFLALSAVVVFGVLLDRLLREDARRLITATARVSASALVPGPQGDLADSVARLRQGNDQLIAVATLSPAGQVRTVYPHRSAFRRVVNKVLAGGGPAAVNSPVDGAPLNVVGVTLPVGGGSTAASGQVLMVLRPDPYRARWWGAMSVFTACVSVLSLLSARSMSRWFDRRVAQPVRGLSQAMRRPPDSPHALRPSSAPGGWRETAEIAELLQELLHGMRKSEERARRVEHQTQHELRTRERGFQRELRRARDQATMDALTRLRNRAFLEKRLESLFERQQTDAADLSIVMIDVDNFKQYNDTHGHLAGDRLLGYVGSLLRAAIRPTDHAIRYGGDEFLLLLPETDAEEAAQVTERLVRMFAQYVRRMGRRPRLSMSAGVASIRRDRPRSGHDLLVKADAALYAAKRKGKNLVVVHEAA